MCSLPTETPDKPSYRELIRRRKKHCADGMVGFKGQGEVCGVAVSQCKEVGPLGTREGPQTT